MFVALAALLICWTGEWDNVCVFIAEAVLVISLTYKLFCELYKSIF